MILSVRVWGGCRGRTADPGAVTAAFFCSLHGTPPFLTEPLRLESDITGVGKSLRQTAESPDENQVRQGVLDPVHRPKRRQ